MKHNFLLFCLFFTQSAFPVAGRLDQTFNPNGQKPGVRIQEILLFSQINSLRLNNNKITTSGYAFDTSYRFAHARFNLNGSLDQTLNPNGNLGPKKGIVVSNLGFSSIINGSVNDSDGKLVVCGTYRKDQNALEQLIVARYNKNGTFDQTFNKSGNLGPRKGVVVKNFALTSAGHAITIDQYDKILVAGSIWQNNAGHVFGVLRFLKNGRLDKTFNANGAIPGVFSLNIDQQVSRILAIKIDAQNRILVAGYSTLGFTIARLKPNGTLDETFNSNGQIPGVFTIMIGQDNPSLPAAQGIAINSNGKIYICGSTTLGFTLLRLKPNGTLDTTFNQNGNIPGVVTTTINELAYSNDIFLDENEKIVVTGYSSKNNDLFRVFTMARYNRNGSLDTTFNPNGSQPGTVSTRIQFTASSFSSRLMKRNQKILLAGFAGNQFTIARYLGK